MIVPAQVMIEPMVLRQGKRSPSEVPLAGMESRVSFLSQVLRQSFFLQRERTQKTPRPHLVSIWIPSAIRQPLGKHQSGWVFARQYGSSRGGTHHASRIGIRETNPRRSKLVNVGGLVKFASLAGEIHPAQVIDQKQNDVLSAFGEE